MDSIINKIKEKYNGFSKGQKLIADFLINNFDKAAFLTASKLGKTVGVSESTVVRFACELGFDGYPNLQNTLKDLVKTRLTSIQRIEIANEKTLKHGVLKGVMLSDIDKIKKTIEETDEDTFESVANKIIKAKKIFIIGSGSSTALVDFLGFYFNIIFENVNVISSNLSSDIFDKLIRINKNDILIGISFPRYSKKTISAMKFALEKGASVIAVTDSEKSPLSEVSTDMLMARSDMASFVDSLVAPLSLINALIATIGRKKEKDVLNTFHTLEEIWDKYDVYEKD